VASPPLQAGSALRRRALWLGRGLAALTAAVVLLAGSGIAYQWTRSAGDLRRFPPPGRLIDVGGFRLHLLCEGSGEPTVVMDAGLGDSYLTWQSIQPLAARSTRVCSYDRAGLGYSDPGPRPRDSRRIVAELHALLQHARLPGPYILVGHSFGGFNTRLFAYTYPEEVAGLVLVDASHEDQWRLFPAPVRSITESYGRDLCRQSTRAPLGIERLRGVTAADTMAAAPAQRSLATTLGFRTPWYAAACEELRAFPDTSAEEVRRARRALAIPVYILDGSADFARELEDGGVPSRDADSAAAVWHALHRELLAISPQARLIVARSSSHYVQFDQPDLVLGAIADAIAAARGPRSD